MRRPRREQVIAELSWTIERAVEHLGEPRATRYLRKFYPWYVTRLGLETDAVKRLQASLQAAQTLRSVDTLLELSIEPAGRRPEPCPGAGRPRYTAALARAPCPSTSPLEAGFCMSANAPPTS